MSTVGGQVRARHGSVRVVESHPESSAMSTAGGPGGLVPQVQVGGQGQGAGGPRPVLAPPPQGGLAVLGRRHWGPGSVSWLLQHDRPVAPSRGRTVWGLAAPTGRSVARAMARAGARVGPWGEGEEASCLRVRE